MSSYASASLYVGDLLSEVTESQLFEIFNAVGPVASVRVCRDAATRRSLGYAYVNFHRVEDAERTLDTMNFTNIRGKPCRIMWSQRDPALRKSGAGNIFVKNLAKSIDNKTLYDTFSMFGNILSCKVSTNSKAESLGYGFVHYESEEAAKNAIERVNGMIIAETEVRVMPFRAKNERSGGDKANFTNLYVKQLPEDIGQEKLSEMFSFYGTVTSVMLAVDEENKSRGFGFVNFEKAEDAKRAMDELNAKEFGGKQIYVGRAQKKEERERQLRDRFEQLRSERQKKYAGVNLYVKNLSDEINDDELREAFAKHGDIVSCKVMSDTSGKSRGFGFVCFATPEEAQNAVMEMNGTMLKQKPLYVAIAQRKDVRRAQLEAQYAARSKMMQNNMYAPAQGMFYPTPGIPGPQRVVYPPQQLAGRMPGQRWVGQQQGRPQIMPPAAYMGVPNMNGPRGAVGSAAPRGGRQRGPAGNKKGGGQQPRRGQGQVQQPFRGPGQPGQVRREPGSPGQMPQVPMGAVPIAAQPPLTIQALAAAPEEQQKQMIGERLFPLIQQQEPALAGKITGMLLEMDNGELLHLLESPDARNEKIQEALSVLHQHKQQQEQAPQ